MRDERFESMAKGKRRLKRDITLEELLDLDTRSDAEIKRLLDTAKQRLELLKALLAEVSDHWGYEDPIYRFYHHSFKVYGVQAQGERNRHRERFEVEEVRCAQSTCTN